MYNAHTYTRTGSQGSGDGTQLSEFKERPDDAPGHMV